MFVKPFKEWVETLIIKTSIIKTLIIKTLIIKTLNNKTRWKKVDSYKTLTTTIIRPMSWLVNLIRFSWRTLEKILGIVPRKFPGIDSEELFAGNSDRVMRISSEWVTRNSSDLVPRNGLRKIPRNSCRHFHRIFLWKIPGSFRRFPGIIPGNFRGFFAKLLVGTQPKIMW